MTEPSSVTHLILAYRSGDKDALGQLADLLYPELKAMARRRVNGRGGLGATTLVQETFLKMLSGGGVKPEDRHQFFGLAATIMRQIIIDDARYATAQKRDGQEFEFTDERGKDSSAVQAEFLLQVDEALNKLAERDERLARAFECRYFGGYSTEETAQILEVSVRSAERYWSQARQLLAQELAD